MLKRLPRVVFAFALAGALSFGTTQVFAAVGEDSIQRDPASCEDFCNELCGGTCDWQGKCTCM